MKGKEKIITLPIKELISFIWSFVRPYRFKFWAAAFLRFIGDVAWLYPAYALAEIVTFLTEYQTGDDVTYMYWIIGIWFGALIIRPFAMNVAKYYGYQIAERTGVDLYEDTLKHLLKLNIEWHEKENTGNKMEKLYKGMMAMNSFVRMMFDYLIEITVNFVGMFIIFSYFDPVISISIVVFAVFYFFASLKLSKKAAKASYKANVEWEKVGGSFYESLNNIHTVKLLTMRTNILKDIAKKIKVLMERVKTRIFWYRARQIVNMVNGEAFRVILVAYIAWGIIEGRYEVGFLVLFFGYFNRIWESVHELAEVSDKITTYRYSIQRMIDMRQEPITIEDNSDKSKAHRDWKTLSLKNLSFQYGKNNVLQDINLTLKRGEKVGIVGLSGAGKSTLFKLFLKQYEDYTGDILLDDTPVKKLTKESYLGLTAVVPQETELFNLSLEKNITLAKTGTSKTDKKTFAKALKIAHIDQFLNKLKDGVDTLVGEKGVKLSGGEKQRVGIARAVYREPHILFMDEATSHLDIESERNIQDALHMFFKEVTAVVIAHRLSTIKEMDRIVVLEAGKILEEGSFDVLMKKKGRFHELWQQQRFE